MKFIGNILWFIGGGLESGISWLIAGLFCYITIIGIPLGNQCFKIAGLAFFPFGKEIKSNPTAISTLGNIFWIIFLGIPLAVGHIFLGLIWCCTIIGIPFGLQFFKLAQLSIAPFGKIVG